MSVPAVVRPPGNNTLPQQPPGDSPPSAYQWMLGWVVLIILLALASKTEIGHTIIYYSLVLILVFLLVTQYQFIREALTPVGQPAPAT